MIIWNRWGAAALVSVLGTCNAIADPEADWLERSTAPGVTMSTNFDVAADVFDFAVDDPSHYEHETSIKKSGGGSLKTILLDDEAGAGHDWWRFLDDDKVPFGSAESGLRDEYWLAYSVYLPQEYYDWVFRMVNSKKFSITSSHPFRSRDPVTREVINFPIQADRRTGSSVPNELVFTDHKQSMHVGVYIQNIDGSAVPQSSFRLSNRVCGLSSDFLYVNTIDNGPQSNTPKAWPGDQRSQACRDFTAQYGMTFSYAQSSVHPGHSWPVQGQRRTDMAQPYPDPIAAEPTWRPGWNTVMYHIKFPSQWESRDGTLEVWIAHPGDQGWTKLFEKFDVVGRNPGAVQNGIQLNNGVDGYFHWGIWLTPFRTGGQPEPGVRPNTFIVYDEVIVSTSPIAAPNSIRSNAPTNLRAE